MREQLVSDVDWLGALLGRFDPAWIPAPAWLPVDAGRRGGLARISASSRGLDSPG